MKRFVLLTLLAGVLLTTGGCLGTPGYSAKERHRMIARNWSYEGGMLVEDLDYVLLLRPASKLTTWNVR